MEAIILITAAVFLYNIIQYFLFASKHKNDIEKVELEKINFLSTLRYIFLTAFGLFIFATAVGVFDIMVGGDFNMAFIEISDDGSGDKRNVMWSYKFSFWFSLGTLIVYLAMGGKLQNLFKFR
jgi:hypothetical protein